MRKLMYIVIGAVVLFAGLQAWTVAGTKRTPQQPYTVLRTIGALEVRHYPAALAAETVRPGGTYKQVANPSFRTLAGYIFGGNADGASIAMTAPVHMQLDPDSARMRFIMPEGLSMDSLPAPNDRAVQLRNVPEEVVAVLRFGGFADEARITGMTGELLRSTAAAGLVPIGPARFLGYDPPWQLVARRNEVAVPVSWP
ncbi:MAG: heme-binding protein [Flavobacteriales bacterium]|jgi:hypothetical protein|nr:MAG: heme-binding protein [Flavobacteriales bacterium]